MGIGALLNTACWGAATFGVGELFGATGSFMNEVGRGLSHGLLQGGFSVLEGGDFLSGFASGALGSWVGHGASALGLTRTSAGALTFSSLSGGVGSWATGGNFWRGVGSGLTVGLLNQVQHDVQAKQQSNQYQKTLKKFNELAKDINDPASLSASLANYFTKGEIAWLSQTGKIMWAAGVGFVGVDAFLTIDAVANGQPWGGHTYDTVLGVVGLLGPAGAATAASIDSYVRAGKYLQEAVRSVNTTGKQMIMNQIIRGF